MLIMFACAVLNEKMNCALMLLVTTAVMEIALIIGGVALNLGLTNENVSWLGPGI